MHRWRIAHRIMLKTAIIMVMIVLPLSAFAQTVDKPDPCAITDFTQAIKMQIEIPGVTIEHGGSAYIKNLGCYIVGIYRYFAGVAGILTTVFVMYGGFRYVVSFGNQSQIQSAKETISSALIGLLLVISSYSILYFINPNLTRFDVIQEITTIDPFQEGWCEEIIGATPTVEGQTACGNTGYFGNERKPCVYQGTNCVNNTLCAKLGGEFKCVEAEGVCEEISQDENIPCEKINEQMVAAGILDHVCILASQNVSQFVGGDTRACYYANTLNCDAQWVPVSCNIGEGQNSACWDATENKPRSLGVLTCSSNKYIAQGSASICCAEDFDVDCRTTCNADEITLSDCKMEVSDGTFINYLNTGTGANPDACTQTRLNNGESCCMHLELKNL